MICHARTTYLCTNTDSGADLDLWVRDLGADLCDDADNLVSWNARGDDVSPSSVDGVDVTATDTAGENVDVDVSVLCGLEVEVDLVEVSPVGRVRDGVSLWLNFGHFDCSEGFVGL